MFHLLEINIMNEETKKDIEYIKIQILELILVLQGINNDNATDRMSQLNYSFNCLVGNLFPNQETHDLAKSNI